MHRGCLARIIDSGLCHLRTFGVAFIADAVADRRSV
jgi:hypothetical protein